MRSVGKIVEKWVANWAGLGLIWFTAAVLETIIVCLTMDYFHVNPFFVGGMGIGWGLCVLAVGTHFATNKLRRIHGNQEKIQQTISKEKKKFRIVLIGAITAILSASHEICTKQDPSQIKAIVESHFATFENQYLK